MSEMIDILDENELVKRFLEENRGYLGPDLEIQRNHHIAPRSEREETVFAKGYDRYAMAEVRSNLIAALDEVFDIVELTSGSPAAQCGDMSTAYFTASGDLAIACPRGILGFVVCLHYTIRFIHKYFINDPTVGVEEGDAFLINDCRYGGLHSPDQHMFMPIFHQGELVSWAVCAMHEGEIGAKVPGGMGPTIETIWDEGFRGSPIKIVENYRLKTDLVTLVQHHSREPQVMLADLKARLAACRRMEKRFHEQIAQYGVENMIAMLRGSVEQVTEEARRRTAEMPDGTMRSTLFGDESMREPALMKIPLALTIKGDKMVFDFRGCAPQLFNRPINSIGVSQCIAVAIAMGHFLWPDLPTCQAIIDHAEFIHDPDTLCNASNDVPLALGMQPMFKTITSAQLCFHKFIYGAPKRYAKVMGGWYNQPAGIIYGGINQHLDSVGNVCGDINGMGGGARPDRDGEHSLAPSFGTMCDLGESEILEGNMPFICQVSKRLWPDNVGFGKYRGGGGYQFGLMRFGQQMFGFQTLCGGSYFPSTVGLFGGYGSTTGAVIRIRGKNLFKEFKERPELYGTDMFKLLNDQPFEDAIYETIPMAAEFELYPEGELFMMTQGAGGGYGDVLERDPELVIKDLEENVISPETACNLYKVVYDPENRVVDVEATEAARAEERKARIARGLTWDEYMAKHVLPEPPEAIRHFYFGRWNQDEEVHAGPYGKALPGQAPMVLLPDPKDVKLQQLTARVAELESGLAGEAASANCGGDSL